MRGSKSGLRTVARTPGTFDSSTSGRATHNVGVTNRNRRSATMREFPSPSPAVVVGIDGSRTAVDAALWAVDEAVSRDIPLRLVYAIDPDTSSSRDPEDAARALATAELAVRDAFTAVESTGKPVKIEVEILQDRPTRALLQAARSADLLWFGSMGLRHSTRGTVGSTAAALASSAHSPVAIVRGHDPLRAKQQ